MRQTLALSVCFASALVLPRAAEAQVRVASYSKPDIAVDLYGWVSPRMVYMGDNRAAAIPRALSFELGQARLGAVATLGRWGRMHAELDLVGTGVGIILTSTSLPILLDAYGVIVPYRSRFFGVEISMGRFRVPFSRQRLLQPYALQTGELAKAIGWALPNRELGAMLSLDAWDRKMRLYGGIFNGGWNARIGLVSSPTGQPGGGLASGTTITEQPFLLYAGRVEFLPLGDVPAYEGDLRPVAKREKPLLAIGASALSTGTRYRFDLPDITPGSFSSLRVGADIGVWYRGASLYFEALYAKSNARPAARPPAVSTVIDERFVSTYLQLGYFVPVGVLREHLELVARLDAQAMGVATDDWFLDASLLPRALGAGVNVFFDRGHRLKTQLMSDYTRQTGELRVFLQATAGF